MRITNPQLGLESPYCPLERREASLLTPEVKSYPDGKKGENARSNGRSIPKV